MAGAKPTPKPAKPAPQDNKAAADQPAAGGTSPGKSGAPTAANTPVTFYLDTPDIRADCAGERAAIDKNCAADNKKASEDAFKQGQSNKAKSKIGGVVDKVKEGVGALDSAASKLYGYKRNPDNAWVEDHCKGLWVKPAGANIEQFTKRLEEIKKELEQGIAEIVKKAGGQIVDKTAQAGKDYAIRAGEKELVSLATVEIPVVGEIIIGGVTLYNFADGVWTTGKAVVGAVGKAAEAYQQIQAIRDDLGKLADLISKKLSPTDLWADVMTGVAELNPCLRAKRCQLVPFNGTKAAQQARSGKGCCPGQTGHHLLPSEMFKECASYTKEKELGAPTVCVEGVNNSQGSHGLVHGLMEYEMQAWRKEHGDQISNKDAIDKAVESHRTIFKPACSKKCLEAQLKAYYDDLCKDQMKPRGGKGTDIEEGDTGTGEKKGR